MSGKTWPAPQTQAERDGDRIADLMKHPRYWQDAGLQAEVSALFQKYYSTPASPQPEPAAPPGVTEAGLRAMQRDPRYARPDRRDPAFVQQVDAGWRALHPGDLPTSHTGRAE
ncbi:hypothetical protein DFH01_00235 [Falsiroseomonas bella]|uniref:Uncharacterized protein n=1 Tax=Falsiroseomonas bella TaxID=2184016 RepID=A0A317FG66_9PROT|nr:hypothetical protein [Falsiroseomonas bella]PWS37785.1 hypothetical protein DFH01_00235 [Falsiroseomonas bella]